MQILQQHNLSAKSSQNMWWLAVVLIIAALATAVFVMLHVRESDYYLGTGTNASVMPPLADVNS